MTTCQICRRLIKTTKGGLIIKHGYHGNSNGPCQGSGHAPYEVARDAIPAYRDEVQALADNEDNARIADIYRGMAARLTEQYEAWKGEAA